MPRLLANGTRVEHKRSGRKGEIYDHGLMDGRMCYSIAWDDDTLTLMAPRSSFRLERS